MTRKNELIAKYRGKPIRHFAQYDAFIDVEPDHIVRPDEDGDALFAVETHELMAFNNGVRVLIADGIEPEDAARALTKIADWVERDLGRTPSDPERSAGETDDFDDIEFWGEEIP